MPKDTFADDLDTRTAPVLALVSYCDEIDADIERWLYRQTKIRALISLEKESDPAPQPYWDTLIHHLDAWDTYLYQCRETVRAQCAQCLNELSNAPRECYDDIVDRTLHHLEYVHRTINPTRPLTRSARHSSAPATRRERLVRLWEDHGLMIMLGTLNLAMLIWLVVSIVLSIVELV